MQGHSLMDYIPLHKTALERSPDLWGWIKAWWKKTNCPDLKLMEAEDWFRIEGHKVECSVWAPCPLVADVMLEELCNARLKRPWGLQLVLIPRLMTSRWRKQLRKAADLLVSLPLIDNNLWGKPQHEPLIFALCLPLSVNFPWQHKRRGDVVRLEGTLPGLWKTDYRAVGTLLRELCTQSWESRQVQRSLVPRLL